MRKWKLMHTKLIYNSKFVSVYNDRVKLPTDKEITFTRVELQDFVSVLPIMGNELVMVEVLRYPINHVSLEIPSGIIENGESPKVSALRELEEETGYIAKELVNTGWYHPLSRSIQRAHLFLARKLTKGIQKPESTEQIRVKYVSLSEVRKMLEAGKVTHAPSLLALQGFLLNWKSKKYQS